MENTERTTAARPFFFSLLFVRRDFFSALATLVTSVVFVVASKAFESSTATGAESDDDDGIKMGRVSRRRGSSKLFVSICSSLAFGYLSFVIIGGILLQRFSSTKVVLG